MKEPISENARVEHIFNCIKEIETAIAGKTFESFVEDHVLRIAIVKWLEIIGEAANHISNKTKEGNDKIEWKRMIGLRNVAVHEYFGINYETIWETATISLQQLKEEMKTINLSTE